MPDTADARRFACAQCGAPVEFAPGTTSLKCPYCGHKNPIAAAEAVAELDYGAALAAGAEGDATEEVAVVKCGNCAAEFSLDPTLSASRCPFCGTPVVAESRRVTQLRPRALLPFAIDRKAAAEAFRKWLRGLWLAPHALKRLAHTENGFAGMYVPYWTYDAATQSDYTGERGINYTRTVPYTTRVDGKTVTRTRTVTETRWSPASGRVTRDFDDVLVLASTSLPKSCAEKLEPWDLGALVPYDEGYLRGFGAEHYQVSLDQGFGVAKGIMDTAIRADVRHDIGGDQQRIHHLHTVHDRLTYKHVLLPVWINGYRFARKTYSFVVNARTGEVQGQRPWSWAKIGAAVAAGVVALILIAVLVGGSR